MLWLWYVLLGVFAMFVITRVIPNLLNGEGWWGAIWK